MQKSCLIICNKIENQNFKQVAPDSLIKNTVFTAIKTIVKKTELIVVISEKFLKSNILLLPTLLRLQNIKKISSIVLVSDSNYYFSQIIVVNINELSTVLKNLNGSSPAPVSDNYTDVFYDFLLLNTLELLNVVFLEDYKMIGRVFNKIAELLEICLMPATAFIGQTTKDATELYISPNSFVDGNTIKEILSEKGLTFTNLKIYEQKKEQQYTKKYLEESKLFFLKNNNFFAGIIFANNQIKDLDRLDTVIDIIFNKIFDIINIKSAVIREHMISVTDYLTGIYNRRFFDEFLKKEIVIMKRKKSVFSLLLFDIDYFKKINDTYGHTAGDQILVYLCNLVSKHLRKSDIFARIGGEEFAILLPDTDEKGSYYLAEKIRNLVESKTFEVDNNKINFTISIGLLVGINVDKLDYNTIYKLTDDALYEAKKRGRNRTIKYIY